MKIMLLGGCDVLVVTDRTSLKRPAKFLTLLCAKRLRAWLSTPLQPL